ncbi:GH3 auxin-responsive promoter family protein [Gilvibacter sediminis]|uniref:GH3 auxin-responsive promoter family protein n=1 Tax=Gilvibacter sediminis TaxID=379071 RepID=UPI0023505640|nr:GH3 auxin-responsive promoter family protein [Gilvibacter sediminis]MDC7996804.1 GH3 auxin-responsive promoter family protein [Gilvibacter sediminis]
MSLKSFAAKILAKRVKRGIDRWAQAPKQTQLAVLQNLVQTAKNTRFGMDHNFEAIQTPEDFAAQVPIRDYEALRSYVDEVVAGKPDILWPGKPLYFAKTSGTTSGAKYIPLTKESMPEHIKAARNAILCYIAETGNADFVDGKMIFLQGSPEMDEKNGIKMGRLSGIVAHYVPSYLQKNRMPSWETNCIEDWETKVDAIVEETIKEDMRVISGIPSWVQMYFERLIEQGAKPVGELFPNFKLFIYGGVNFAPYKARFEQLIGRSVPSIELFPASEGFFAFQDSQNEKGMLLLLDAGIYYEFVKAEDFFKDNPKRIPVWEVELGVNYVMLISTTAGMWGYNLGDTVQFTSLAPYRVIVSGRIKHFISAFGEHVIGKEVEQAMKSAIDKFGLQINEFTVAPQINPESGLPYHEWLVEAESLPDDLSEIAAWIDREMQAQNTYYLDLIEGSILRTLVISPLKPGSFKAHMKSKGKLGGQNKIPRLSNDRKIADALLSLQG